MKQRWPIAQETLEAFRKHGTLPRQLSWFLLVLATREDLLKLAMRYEVELAGSDPGSKSRVKARYRLKMIQIHLRNKD